MQYFFQKGTFNDLLVFANFDLIQLFLGMASDEIFFDYLIQD